MVPLMNDQRLTDSSTDSSSWTSKLTRLGACQSVCETDDHANIRILIHGGAWDIPVECHWAHAFGVKRAFEAALAAYHAGASGLNIVVAALEILEDDPTFDAGRGSFLNECGEVELDAGLMEGSSLRAGAVAGIRNFLHPSKIAFDVLDKTHHAFLVGEGAEQFALRCGHLKTSPEDLVDPREREVFARWLAAGKPDAKVFFAAPAEKSSRSVTEPHKRGTVGVVVALRNRASAGSAQSEPHWNLFAGTSTGGTPGKMQGRVGDVPVIGAGVYADDEGAAVSCTGWGEGLLRIAAGQRISAAVRAGVPIQQAVERTLMDLHRRLEGHAGIIAIDGHGRMGASFTTPFMAFAGPAGVVTHLQRTDGCDRVPRQEC